MPVTLARKATIRQVVPALEEPPRRHMDESRWHLVSSQETDHVGTNSSTTSAKTN